MTREGDALRQMGSRYAHEEYGWCTPRQDGAEQDEEVDEDRAEQDEASSPFMGLRGITFEWEGTVAARSLLGFRAGLLNVAKDALRNRAVSPETAKLWGISHDLLVHALLDGEGKAVGFVMRSGDEAFATSMVVPDEENVIEAVTVFRLGVGQQSDEEILAGIVSGGGAHWFDRGFTAKAVLHDNQERKSRFSRQSVGMEWWPRYAELVRPIAISVPPRKWPKNRVMIGSAYEALSLIEADGGFRGVACDTRTDELSKMLAGDILSWAAPHVLKTADTLLAREYEWPKGVLEYSDVDRFAFAVRSPDGRTVGVWHRNIDLFVGRNEQMTVLTLDEAGAPTSIAIYPTWRAPHMDEDDLASDSITLPDMDSTPMRPTRGMLAQLIASGEGLPPCACGLDLATGTLLPGSDLYADHILDNAVNGISENAWAAIRLRAGKLPGYVENRRPFDEGFDFADTPTMPRL